ncbi:hypothetical protein PSDVSF_00760 [Pseudodesulfovibrio sediminis]|uniref:Uncharacterized protein n=1 Tax=Pseudodesulfovibrio sediminis TaxID=2810563 RepID=A0ABN6EMN0_9BACT|nr:hypothetical protein PSDVSF_00760 [Pseudodesulfovibrio sediminis]
MSTREKHSHLAKIKAQLLQYDLDLSHIPDQSPVLKRATIALKVFQEHTGQLETYRKTLQRRLTLVDNDLTELFELGQVLQDALENYLHHREDGEA